MLSGFAQHGMAKAVFQAALLGVMLAAQMPVGAQAHATRTGEAFVQLETALLVAMRQQDGTQLAAMLDPDFEMTVAQDPGTPVPREDWLASLGQLAGAGFQVRELSVRDWGEVAIASFVLQPALARPKRASVFVVDTWKKTSPGSWRLVTRYAAPVAGSRHSIPGDPGQSAGILKKY